MFKPKFPSIIKLPKSRKFEFIPRFYDLEKEEMDKRKGSMNTGAAGKNIFFNYRKNHYLSKKDSNNYLVRFTIILTILTTLAYWLIS